MKRILFIVFFIITPSIFAQLSISSLSKIYDAASVSLGEASVANSNYATPLNINPALLSDQKDFIVYYNQRSINWIKSLDGFKFFSLGAQIPTSIGSFAVNYKKFDQKDLSVSSVESPDTVGKIEAYDQTFEVMYGTKIFNNLSCGAIIKIFTMTNETLEMRDANKFNSPLFLDLGLAYKVNEVFSSSIFSDGLIFGVDIKNYGSDLINSYQYLGGPDFSETQTKKTIIKVDRFLRIGFGYKLEINADNNDKIFRFNFNAEYKNQLNRFFDDNSRRDHWGMGMEASFLDIVSLRLGAIANPYSSIYGNKGAFNARYGFGLKSPIINLIKNLPFNIALDYAVIPIVQIGFFENEMNKRNLDAFNISLRFPGLPK